MALLHEEEDNHSHKDIKKEHGAEMEPEKTPLVSL